MDTEEIARRIINTEEDIAQRVRSRITRFVKGVKIDKSQDAFQNAINNVQKISVDMSLKPLFLNAMEGLSKYYKSQNINVDFNPAFSRYMYSDVAIKVDNKGELQAKNSAGDYNFKTKHIRLEPYDAAESINQLGNITHELTHFMYHTSVENKKSDYRLWTNEAMTEIIALDVVKNATGQRLSSGYADVVRIANFMQSYLPPVNGATLDAKSFMEGRAYEFLQGHNLDSSFDTAVYNACPSVGSQVGLEFNWGNGFETAKDMVSDGYCLVQEYLVDAKLNTMDFSNGVTRDDVKELSRVFDLTTRITIGEKSFDTNITDAFAQLCEKIGVQYNDTVSNTEKLFQMRGEYRFVEEESNRIEKVIERLNGEEIPEEIRSTQKEIAEAQAFADRLLDEVMDSLEQAITQKQQQEQTPLQLGPNAEAEELLNNKNLEQAMKEANDIAPEVVPEEAIIAENAQQTQVANERAIEQEQRQQAQQSMERRASQDVGGREMTYSPSSSNGGQ